MPTGILGAIGDTPLIKLVRALDNAPFSLFAKLEGLNVGGSAKDRVARSMIETAIEAGTIKPSTVIVESSSGNMGIGLAQMCRYYNLRFICVVDAKTTDQNRRLLEVYGAEVEVVRHPDPVTGEFLAARLARVRELLAELEDAYWPNQYGNYSNAKAHWRTMNELMTALDGRIHYVFCATSTCGTLRGCADYIRAHELSTRVVAVDAVGSVIFGGPSCTRLIPGHGASVRPALYRAGLADSHVHVTDAECVIGCRTLLQREALLVGGSSGAVFAAIQRMRDQIEPGAICVAVFADRGERYLDTIFSDTWVAERLGSLANVQDTQIGENRWASVIY